jgi:hypothetical protein
MAVFMPKPLAILEVPFKEKDEAKQLGAWWDPEIKKWFVPPGKDLQLFKKWIPEQDTQPHGSSEPRA